MMTFCILLTMGCSFVGCRFKRVNFMLSGLVANVFIKNYSESDFNKIIIKKERTWCLAKHGNPYLEFVLSISPIQVHTHSSEKWTNTHPEQCVSRYNTREARRRGVTQNKQSFNDPQTNRGYTRQGEHTGNRTLTLIPDARLRKT